MSSDKPTEPRNTSVLICEDEAVIAGELKATLEEMGYCVTALASSGEIALERAAEELPDVVLMDVHLVGEMDGVETATKLRAKFNVPVVFLTAYADDQTLERARAAEPLGFLVKPVQERELRAAVEVATYVGRVQARLRESELRYRTVADFTYDWETWRGADGKYVYVSPSCERLTGFTCDEFLADPELFLRIVHPDDRPRIVAHWDAEKMPEDLIELDFRIITKRGELRWISHACRIVTEGDVRLGRRGSNRDISARKQADAERERIVDELTHVKAKLEQSEHKLEYAGRMARIGYWEYFPGENKIELSSVLGEVLGQQRTLRLSWDTFASRVHPDDRRRVEEALTSPKSEVRAEYRYLHPQGDIRFLSSHVGLERNAEGVIMRVFGATQDVTQSKRVELMSVRLGRIVEASINEVLVLDATTFRILQANCGAQKNSGYSLADLKMLSLFDLSPQLSIADWQEAVRQLRQGESEQATIETRLSRRDGSSYDAEIRLQLVTTESPPVFVAIVQDVTERNHAVSLIRHAAVYDALTDLPNRRLFVDLLLKAVALARRRESSVSVLYVDIDGFKSVNDVWGHDVGDLVLKELSARLVRCFRESDTIARLGGDEFAAIVAPSSERESLESVVERMLKAVAEPVDVQGEQVVLTASIGIASYPSDADNPTDLLRRADIAMYEAKNHGKNRFAFASSAPEPASLRPSKPAPQPTAPTSEPQPTPPTRPPGEITG